jgi:hypothetical protein
MSRKSLSRTTAEAIGPLVVPLVTKVAIPIAIESLRRGGKFDSDRFYREAKESLSDGYKKSRPQLDDLRDELSSRSGDLYEDLRKKGAEFLEDLAGRGSKVADDWMERTRPRRRRFGLGKALIVLTVVGVGIAVLAGRD